MREAEKLVEYLNECWTPFHAVEHTVGKLEGEGFEKLSERETWKVVPGGKYYFTRNASAIVAFAVGGKYEAGNGFRIIGAHTDSPCPKLKPVSKETKNGWLMVNCQNYGGGLWYTWFDRDLSVAGRVVYKSGGKLKSGLVRVNKPIMRIPSLAIHLNRGANDGFKVNFQQHMSPVLATSIKDQLNRGCSGEQESKKAKAGASDGVLQQHPLLLDILAKELGISAEDIVDFELQACDTQPSAIGGAMDELVFSGRLDNLASCYASLEALTTSLGSLGDDDSVRVVVMYDHEECGSCSAPGAGSTMASDLVKRVTTACCKSESGKSQLLEIALQKSFLLSADMAHAIHPNYADKHESQHGPQFHKGVVIKHNANQRYATNSITATLFRECGRKRGLPCQEFVVRSDMGCGSTIGPIVSTKTGMRTADVGIPQWSMHSVREVCGCDDVGYAVEHFRAFWEELGTIEKDLLDSME
ncbi:aminopeptidase I zinc metalloprotease [Chloropicon primus]|nr:aminopeptidase I zinc metalloprotease [Chloropicon primus]